MKEDLVETHVLEQKALGIVNRLHETAAERQRVYPPHVDAVLVFSGPGTYYDRLKPEQEEWMRWMDRDRIRAGVALVRELTASTINDFAQTKLGAEHIGKNDIMNKGPFFVYNGIPVENKVLREALDSPFCKLPKEKVLIIDEVRNGDKVIPIRHTGDQIQSFYQEIINPESPLHYATNIALVSHTPHYIRIPFYISKYENDYECALPKIRRNFYAYGLKDRPGVEKWFMKSEMERFLTYAERGDIAIEPIPLRI